MNPTIQPQGRIHPVADIDRRYHPTGDLDLGPDAWGAERLGFQVRPAFGLTLDADHRRGVTFFARSELDVWASDGGASAATARVNALVR
ncbi:MAG: hypothetical protein KA914_17040 [Ottowia sp.]|nr:hypothetical protein [Ottowia sp.]